MVLDRKHLLPSRGIKANYYKYTLETSIDLKVWSSTIHVVTSTVPNNESNNIKQFSD